MLTKSELIKCQADIRFFADKVLEIKLWQHQVEFLTCPGKVIAVASARQIGKSTACAVKAIHTAFSKRSKVLVVSPSLRQSGLMFAAIREMIGSSPYLRASLIDDTKTYLRLSNGSELWCLPDSPAQIRGFSKVALAIIDEANFCSQELLRAIQYSLLTVPDSQLLMISSPWSTQHWFYQYFRDGQSKKDQNIASFHYTFEVSPLINKDSIEQLKDKVTEEEYKTEILGEWISDENAYFDYKLIEDSVMDYDLVAPDKAAKELAWLGVDWASKGADATVVMLIGILNLEGNTQILAVIYFEVFKKTDFSVVIERIANLTKNYRILKAVSETNGIGDMPTQMLSSAGLNVEGLFTTAQNKINGYGKMKILLQSAKLILPREPELIKQLTNLRYSISDSGASMNISHSKQYQKDDYCDALMFSLLACGDPIVWSDGGKYDRQLIRSYLASNRAYYKRAPELTDLDTKSEFKALTAGLLDRVL